tara:strand:- start:407 stop:787 length:381 start_codon:yes stop_codon:yes gene_type:complete
MNNLPEDIIINILIISDIKLLGKCERINLYYNKLLKKNDYIWKKVADNRWGSEFFKIAKRRSVYISKPLSSYREELIRIINFENYARCNWGIDEYYDLWYKQELDFNKSKKSYLLSIYLSKGCFPI